MGNQQLAGAAGVAANGRLPVGGLGEKMAHMMLLPGFPDFVTGGDGCFFGDIASRRGRETAIFAWVRSFPPRSNETRLHFPLHQPAERDDPEFPPELLVHVCEFIGSRVRAIGRIDEFRHPLDDGFAKHAHRLSVDAA